MRASNSLSIGGKNITSLLMSSSILGLSSRNKSSQKLAPRALCQGSGKLKFFTKNGYQK